ncbi:MAG: hypothetical protein F4Y42_20695 [Caldilineaceae bacterium SB0664_bin_27]|uniref:Uncharacterized protein n=1 Tax=Caldilineaceae bacterium SB0664_bin_27 TaxID=2605260 RepID=A0A6B0YXS0_9CHLR|nr:hypothetical protein [Caldilineaceae bacterium SB0664_bin_27]
MPKTLCKSVKLDGSPCLGHGLPQFDGLCIGHAPRDRVLEWRKRGGRNSSTAARSRKSIPEPYESVIQELRQGLSEVREGKITPAQFNAMCNGVRALAQIHRLAVEETELIHSEETEVAAMTIAGAHGDLVILKAAARISAEIDRYRAESLIQQGLAVPEPGTTLSSDAPPALVLTDAGRRRFGLQKLTSYTQDDFDQIEALFDRPQINLEKWTAADQLLSAMHTGIEEAIADLERGPAPVRDPLTGEVLTEPPAGVKVGPVNNDDEINTKAALEILKKQRRKAQLFTRILEFRYRNELSVLRPPSVIMEESEK